MFKKIYLEITNNCNLDCDFCIKNQRKNKNMTKEEFEIVLKKIENHTNYLYFHLLGEPLIHPAINDLINIASKDFKINITTNGYLINKIKDNKNIRQINISLHSYSDKYKIKPEDYLNNIFDSINVLIQNKTYVSLRLWTKNSFNSEMIKIINNKYNTKIEINENSNIKISNNLYLNTFKEFIWPDLNNDYYSEVGGCYGLIDHIGILVDATVVPCCLDSKGIINLGNIFNEELDDILQRNRSLNMIEGFKNKTKKEELCKHCKFL